MAAADLYSQVPQPVALVRPATSEDLAKAVITAGSRGYQLVPRGGGLSYTGGYLCQAGRSVLVDLSALDRILQISSEDMVVVAEAGVTWKQLYDTLTPMGLRLPFFRHLLRCGRHHRRRTVRCSLAAPVTGQPPTTCWGGSGDRRRQPVAHRAMGPA